MNSKRLVVLLLAAGAAGVVALMVRNLMGGNKPVVAAVAPIESSEVLVASQRIDAGKPISAGQVRWQSWPAKIADASLIQRTNGVTSATIILGTVARAPMVEGEPVTFAKIVKSQGAGFMAATVTPGMRAISISASMSSIVGGFVQPNNRVDVLYTNTTDYPKHGNSKIIAADARVLAVDQAAENATQKAVTEVKTVTLELTADQARAVAMAQATGTLTLALRSLGDDAAVLAKKMPASGGASNPDSGDDTTSAGVMVLRYGHSRKSGGGEAL